MSAPQRRRDAADEPSPTAAGAAANASTTAPAAAATAAAADSAKVAEPFPPPPAVAPPPPSSTPPPVTVTLPPTNEAPVPTGSAAPATAAAAATPTAMVTDAAGATPAAAATTAAAAPAVLASIDVSGTAVLPLIHGHHSAQGIRPTMEDEVVMFDHITLNSAKLNGITSPIAFYGVFDGHGGKKAAEFTREHLVRNLIAALESGLAPEAALTQAFVKTDTDFVAGAGQDTSGTTAVTFLVEQQTRKFWCANAGDSRCIMSRKGAAKPLSVDHKADRPDELDRIRKAGGFVIHKRVMGELAISRAIGDKDFKAQDFKLVIADPEIVADTLNADDQFVVIACDGLYDVMTNDQIAAYVADQLKLALRKSQSPKAGSPASPTAAASATATAATPSASTASAAATPSAAAAGSAAGSPPSPTANVHAHAGGDPSLDALCTRMVTRAIDELHTRDNVSAIVVKLK